MSPQQGWLAFGVTQQLVQKRGQACCRSSGVGYRSSLASPQGYSHAE